MTQYLSRTLTLPHLQFPTHMCMRAQHSKIYIHTYIIIDYMNTKMPLEGSSHSLQVRILLPIKHVPFFLYTKQEVQVPGFIPRLKHWAPGK